MLLYSEVIKYQKFLYFSYLCINIKYSRNNKNYKKAPHVLKYKAMWFGK